MPGLCVTISRSHTSPESEPSFAQPTLTGSNMIDLVTSSSGIPHLELDGLPLGQTLSLSPDIQNRVIRVSIHLWLL